MNKVRYEEMLPHEIVAARQAKAVAYLPLGTLEWHGEHNAVGLDGVKAHELCIRAARQGGGLAMPPLFWGENREISVHDATHDPEGKIARQMKLARENMAPGFMGGTSVDYGQLLLHICYQLKSLGFRVIFMMCGHYPLSRPARESAQRFMAENPEMGIYAGEENEAVRDGLSGQEREECLRADGDHHAGRWETAIMMNLRPELVDMGMLSEDKSVPITSVVDPEAGVVVAHDPRCDDLEEYGRKITPAIVRAMIAITDGMLDQLGLSQ